MPEFRCCDRCDARLRAGRGIDVWDERGAWLFFCSWRCVRDLSTLRHLAEVIVPAGEA